MKLRIGAIRNRKRSLNGCSSGMRVVALVIMDVIVAFMKSQPSVVTDLRAYTINPCALMIIAPNPIQNIMVTLVIRPTMAPYW